MNGQKGQPPAQVQQIREFSSGGLAGVWAEQNTRESIFDAMARKETFGTSGPMIKVRFFASWDLTADDLKRPDFIKLAYAKGVPMGGDLKPAGAKAPTLFRDGDEGSQERQSRPHPDRQRVDRRGRQAARIDSRRRRGAAIASPAPTASCRRSAIPSTSRTPLTRTASARPSCRRRGPTRTSSRGERAFYYARVLEIPTPRWSTIDAARLGMAVPGGLAATIQERAWSSSIWYTPG